MKTKDPYIYKPLAITRNKRLSFAEQDYLCLIAQLSSRSGCVASNAWFARYFGVKPPRASKVISSLASKGFIKTTEQRQGKEVVKRTVEIIDKGINDMLTGVVTKCHEGTNEMGAKGTNKLGEDKLNIKTKDKPKETNAFFESFWSVYPKKVNKPQALKAFIKLNPDAALLEVMLEAIESQGCTEQWFKQDGQFIPHPATWLAGRRWEDQTDTTGGCCMTRELTEEEAIDRLRRGGMIP